MLHAHLIGRKIRMRHLRDGKELPLLFEDNGYDVNYQISRKPSVDTLILPGDEWITECVFDSSDRDKATYGG